MLPPASCNTKTNQRLSSPLQDRHRRGRHQGPRPRHVRSQGAFPPPSKDKEKTAANTTPSPQQGKAKLNAWKKLAEDDLTVEEAQEKYVAKIEEMKVTYGYDKDKEPEAVGAQ